eukprot:361528-Chlamydomonas_euryale.AAC.1
MAAGAKMRAMAPLHLAKAAWAVARLRHAPGRRWLYRLLSESYRCLPAFEARDVAMLAWALATMRVSLPDAFVKPLVARAEALAEEFPPQVCVLLRAHAIARAFNRSGQPELTKGDGVGGKGRGGDGAYSSVALVDVSELGGRHRSVLMMRVGHRGAC